VPAAAPDRNAEAGDLGDADTTATEVRKPDSGGRKRRRTHAPSGVTYWYDEEVCEIDRLVSIFGLHVVKATVASLTERGTDPLPAIVAKALAAARRTQREADAVTSRRREPTTEERAADAVAAERWLAEIKGRQS
jgi:hypothetical protein